MLSSLFDQTIYYIKYVQKTKIDEQKARNTVKLLKIKPNYSALFSYDCIEILKTALLPLKSRVRPYNSKILYN